MAKITISQAMAELSLIQKKLTGNRNFVLTYVVRDGDRVDPLASSQTSSSEEIRRAMQSSNDLRESIVKIRTAIQKSNLEHSLTVEGKTRTVAEWLVWRKDVANQHSEELSEIIRKITLFSRSATARPQVDVPVRQTIVEVAEKALYDEVGTINAIFERLDGALSVHNATTEIEY